MNTAFPKPIFFAAICFPLCVLNLASQSAPANWDNVKALAPGTAVLVAPNRPGDVKGKVGTVTEDSVVVLSRKGSETFTREEIIRISVRENRRKRHAVRGLKWGAVIGAGVGALVSVACFQSTGNPACYPGVIALGAGEIGGLGALIGALIPAGEWREIYHR